MADNEPNYTNPPTLDWAEKASDPDYKPDSVLIKGTEQPKSDNGYVGVDPIYQNHSEERDKPRAAEEGPEAVLEEAFFTEDVDFDQTAPPEGSDEASEQAEEEQEQEPAPSSSTTPAPSTTPAAPSTPPSS